MSVTDGLASGFALAQGREPQMHPELVGVMTLAGNLVLTNQYRSILKIDPAGARDVTLPAEESSRGRYFRILNAADANEAITVKNDTPATVATIGQDEQGEFWCDGTTWYLLAIINIELS